MRSLVLAGAAVVAISAMSSGANAGGALYLGKQLLGECLFIGAVTSVQTNCGFNIVGSGGHHKSNDYNTQTIEQRNKGELKESYRPTKVEALSSYPGGGGGGGKLLQLNGGLNVVEKGDDNTQSIDQYNYYKGPEPDRHSDVVQINVGINAVGSGDDNTQSIEQTNSLTVGGHH